MHPVAESDHGDQAPLIVTTAGGVTEIPVRSKFENFLSQKIIYLIYYNLLNNLFNLLLFIK